MTCPHPVKIVEPIYLIVNGRPELIANVQYCPRHGWPKVGCDRPVGDPKRETKCPQDFINGWVKMVEIHPWAPYYLTRNDKGHLVPEGIAIKEPEFDRED